MALGALLFSWVTVARGAGRGSTAHPVLLVQAEKPNGEQEDLEQERTAPCTLASSRVFFFPVRPLCSAMRPLKFSGNPSQTTAPPRGPSRTLILFGRRLSCLATYLRGHFLGNASPVAAGCGNPSEAPGYPTRQGSHYLGGMRPPSPVAASFLYMVSTPAPGIFAASARPAPMSTSGSSTPHCPAAVPGTAVPVEAQRPCLGRLETI